MFLTSSTRLMSRRAPPGSASRALTYPSMTAKSVIYVASNRGIINPLNRSQKQLDKLKKELEKEKKEQ